MTHLTLEQISSQIDEQLPESDRVLASEHLQDCESCRSEFNRMMMVREAIKDLPRAAVDPWFADHMEAMVMGEVGVDRQWLGPERIAARAVVGLAVLVVGLLIGFLLKTETPMSVSERNLALGSTDSSTQILMSVAELSKDDLLLATMTGE